MLDDQLLETYAQDYSEALAPRLPELFFRVYATREGNTEAISLYLFGFVEGEGLLGGFTGLRYQNPQRPGGV